MPPSFTPSSRRAPLRRLNRFLRESDRVLAAWRAYSEEHTDLEEWPLDPDAYNRRAAARDVALADRFGPLREGAHHLLTTARAQLALLPAEAVQNRWAWQLTVLQDALDRLDTLRGSRPATHDGLPRNAVPGTSAFGEAHAVHHAEGRKAVNEWAAHGHVIREINKAAQRARSRLGPCPTTTLAQATARAEPELSDERAT
jgi:hypothetical protein